MHPDPSSLPRRFSSSRRSRSRRRGLSRRSRGWPAGHGPTPGTGTVSWLVLTSLVATRDGRPDSREPEPLASQHRLEQCRRRQPAWRRRPASRLRDSRIGRVGTLQSTPRSQSHTAKSPYQSQGRRNPARRGRGRPNPCRRTRAPEHWLIGHRQASHREDQEPRSAAPCQSPPRVRAASSGPSTIKIHACVGKRSFLAGRFSPRLMRPAAAHAAASVKNRRHMSSLRKGDSAVRIAGLRRRTQGGSRPTTTDPGWIAQSRALERPARHSPGLLVDCLLDSGCTRIRLSVLCSV